MTYGRNKVFIGGISGNVSKEEIEREFGKYGKLNSVWVAQNPPGFAFVEYMDDRDAKEAIKQLNGQTLFNDNKVRVEHSKDRPSGGRPGGGRGGGSSGGFRSSRANLGGGYRSGSRRGSSGGSGFKNNTGRFSDRREGGRFGNGSSSGSRFGSNGGSSRDRYNGESYSYRSRSPIGQTGRRY